MRKVTGIAALVAVWMAVDAGAIRDKDNQGRWNKPTVNNLPDKEVPGFLVNLGPTGARAILTENTFIIKYIFKGSPADGRLKIDDVITGIGTGTGKGSAADGPPRNKDVATGAGKAGSPAEGRPKNDNVVQGGSGTPFSKHTFGGSPHGYEGPIMDLGLAIERAEAKDGKLILNVVRAGERIDVRIDLELLGSFSPTFPMQCEKSELLRSKALKYLSDSTDAQAVWQPHAKSAVILALLSSENPQQQAAGRKMALAWNSVPGPGTWTWDLSFQLMTLSEYHLLTGDASVLSTLRAVGNLLRKAQYDGHIDIWGPPSPQSGEDRAVQLAHQQLYLGGFGHGPYTLGVGKNGYGPMQYTTIFAVIAWQLAERCGVKADPKGMKDALDFIHRGTNAAGYVAYGGEFTLNNGIIDPVAWKKSKDGDNYVGRAGASLIAHKLSPEFPNSLEYLDLNRGYLKKAYKSLPDGHADSNLGILWGILGAGASEDEAALRTVLDYHKAWFNMMRCHDGSFVLLPGRDYADDGYYMASRYHPTATMALVLGLSYPKLQIQGLQVSIPNLNTKALAGPRLAAYQAIVAKNYGKAARLVDASDPMSVWLEAQAKKAVDGLRLLEKAGRWLDLKEKVADLKKAFGGVPLFDQEAGALDGAAKPFLAADKLLREGQPAKALAALTTPSEALEARIRAAAARIGTYWTTLMNEGRWSVLKKEFESGRERIRGLVEISAFEEALASDAGRRMVEADRLCGEGAFGSAMKALGTLESAPAKALRARIVEGAGKVVAEIEALEKEGYWHSLREALAKAKPKLGDLMEARAKAWESVLATPGGSAWIEAEKQYQKGNLGEAAKGAAPGLLSKIDEAVRERLKQLSALEAKGDWYGLSRELALQRKKLAGAASFDERDAAWQAAFKIEPGKTGLRLGALWARVKESGKRKDVEAFLQQAGDGYYAKEAKALLSTLK